ncbi:NAD(P)H-hydrate dehydratase [Candidatus Clostridium stratigraminis]|uniref:Bifunctional NAD(P)H-hydrate repair enzyme n=1 Tax=Candidatus Clostridium stratigraminis TaxID=3381661 RepID=A0ABW8T3U5_9CLOT
MKIATGRIMKEIDKYCIEKLKIPGIVLMENAAIKVLNNLEIQKYNSYTIICGKGNNGGDGFAAARHLAILEKNIEVFLVGSEEGMTEDCRTNYNILKNMGIRINNIHNLEDANELRDSIERSSVTIDALFGTGLMRNLDGIYDLVISIINENSSYTISIDVPSGFNNDSGKIMGNCVRADKTITFELYKKGFLNYGSKRYTGEVVVENIGIPSSAVDRFHEKEFILDEAMVKARLKARDIYGHKGDYGRVLLVAGSRGFTGAAYLLTEAAVRSGAGLITLCCSEDIQPILSTKLTEAMTINFNETERLLDILNKCNCLAIGPGMGNNEATLNTVKFLLEKANCPIIIDADAINVLKGNLELLKSREMPVILTPHVGEMSRITELSIEYIQENRIEVSKEFAKEYKVIVILKGYNTVITDGLTVIINPTGNSSMASGGMGDCLTGIIASFIGQGYKPLEAAALVVYIHGFCGDKLAEEMFCVSASSLLESIPYIIKELQQK